VAESVLETEGHDTVFNTGPKAKKLNWKEKCLTSVVDGFVYDLIDRYLLA
jgi:hypothetical protein